MTQKITIELEAWEAKELIAILERQIRECRDNPYLSPKVAIYYKKLLEKALKELEQPS